jgi:murein DD-endopeptidase MepM/ murein hydrolase activator NlpD
MKRVPWFFGLFSGLLLIAAACSPAAASVRLGSPQPEPLATTQDSAAVSAQAGDIPETPTATPASGPLETAPEAPAPTPAPSATPAAEAVPTDPPPPPAPCSEDACTYSAAYFLARPIAAPGNNAVDITYRFGSTQGERREPHHGVELLNSFGTPVMAAADGVVVVAGDDRDPTSERGVWPITFYGPYSYFYGNLVVIEHQPPAALLAALPELPRPVYTLYAHLSEVQVETGQQVAAGQQIGAVGLSGIAEGSHLHFEVRLGENTYASVRNPELWLAPRQDEEGRPLGGIAGRVVDSQGSEVVISGGIVLQRLPEGDQGPHDLEFYTLPYEEPALVGAPPFEEIFAIGDLPAGLYRVTFARQGVQQFLVEVLPGQLTVATLRVD